MPRRSISTSAACSCGWRPAAGGRRERSSRRACRSIRRLPPRGPNADGGSRAGQVRDPSHLARAESALGQALSLDADNAAAQCYYAQLEIDLGRVDAALARLFHRTRKGRAEPYVYAALVHACRYGGLLDASVAAAAQHASWIPSVPTSVLHTYYMQGDYERALAEAHQSSDPFEAGSTGRSAGKPTRSPPRAARRRDFASRLLRAFSTGLRATFEGRRATHAPRSSRSTRSTSATAKGSSTWPRSTRGSTIARGPSRCSAAASTPGSCVCRRSRTAAFHVASPVTRVAAARRPRALRPSRARARFAADARVGVRIG